MVCARVSDRAPLIFCFPLLLRNCYTLDLASASVTGAACAAMAVSRMLNVSKVCLIIMNIYRFKIISPCFIIIGMIGDEVIILGMSMAVKVSICPFYSFC